MEGSVLKIYCKCAKDVNFFPAPPPGFGIRASQRLRGCQSLGFQSLSSPSVEGLSDVSNRCGRARIDKHLPARDILLFTFKLWRVPRCAAASPSMKLLLLTRWRWEVSHSICVFALCIFFSCWSRSSPALFALGSMWFVTQICRATSLCILEKTWSRIKSCYIDWSHALSCDKSPQCYDRCMSCPDWTEWADFEFRWSWNPHRSQIRFKSYRWLTKNVTVFEFRGHSGNTRKPERRVMSLW